MSVSATYHDGRDPQPHAVSLDISQGLAMVTGDGIERREPLAALKISDAAGGGRLVRFSDNAFCEVPDGEGLDRLIAAHGRAPRAVSQWEGSLRGVAVAALVAIGLLLAAYWYGIPLVAAILARQVPVSFTEQLSAAVLAVMDTQVFAPSEVPRPRQESIESAFRRLELPENVPRDRYRILFRKSEELGANAVALPSGAIVITDALVTLAGDHRELLGVLAHEAGHVDRRHGLRNMLQNSMISFLIAWFIGDLSTIAAAAPAALIEADYSRELEREADAFAVDVLRTNGISVRHFGDILRRLEQETGTARPAAFPYLSSHPATSERLERLESAY